jgi:PDZ domain
MVRPPGIACAAPDGENRRTRQTAAPGEISGRSFKVRSVLIVALVVVIGAVSAALLISRQSADDLPSYAAAATPAPARRARVRGFGALASRPDGQRRQADIERRLQNMEAKLDAEATKRQHLAERVETLQDQVARADGRSAEAPSPNADPNLPAADASSSSGTDSPAAAPTVDPSLSPMERALAKAGVDPDTAAKIKQQADDLAMQELELRDQATREGWINTPQFRDQMEALQDQDTPIRDQIGDDAYDRYLFAMGQYNRVRVDDVMSGSPGAMAGLQPGDLILRYGDTRVFSPSDLVDATQSGTLGESIQLDVMRNGSRVQVEVRRGPLGLRINAAQDQPMN